MRGKPVHWEAQDTFNPAAVVFEGKVHVLYRAEDDSAKGLGQRTSRIGLATSDDGIHFQRRPAPVFYPDNDLAKPYEWKGGCEDPRVVEGPDGRFYMYYSMWNLGHPDSLAPMPRLGVASSKDLVHWEKQGLVFNGAGNERFANIPHKSASVVTGMQEGRLKAVKINGKYWMYWGENAVHAATSVDLIHWTPALEQNGELKKLITPRPDRFDSLLTECGPPAVLTDRGIVLIYNGKNSGADTSVGKHAYAAGQVLFDADNPLKVLDRCEHSFFKPELTFEKSGQYSFGTVFAEGLVFFKGRWFLYYGTADSFVGVAVAESTPYVPQVEKMPNLPEPLVMRDWKRVARDYDALVFDHKATGEFLPLIWIDRARSASELDTFGLYTVPKKPGQGPEKPNSQEGINCVAAVLGASLVGIDKRCQDGFDYVRMCEVYFSPKEKGGADLFFNRIGIHQRIGSMWYDLFPTVMAVSLNHCYPGHGRLDEYTRRSADTLIELGAALQDGKWYTGYDFEQHKPISNGKWTEGDALAGVAWVEYMAWAKFGEKKYLEAARRAMDTLNGYDRSTFYEILMPYGALLAARVNAEQGTAYNVERMLNWFLDGSSAPRGGWGVIADRWGDYDVSGLQGSLGDGGGYAFAMSTFHIASTMAPLPRYDARYARVIGKLLLNTASSARYFYANALPQENQTCYGQRDFTRDVIAYEGLRKVGLRAQDAGKTPMACGDPLGGRWGGGPYVTDFSLYGSSHVGLMAAVIERTDDPSILQIDCLKTDFFHDKAYPTYLYFNPHAEEKDVRLDVGDKPVDLFDAVTHSFLKRGVQGKTMVRLPADGAVVLVLAPAGGKVSRQGRKLLIDGVVVDYRAGSANQTKE